MSDGHPSQRLEDTIHQRVRLGIMVLLHDVDRSHFTALRDALGQNDGTLSGHLSVLEDAGYVSLEKGYEGKRPRTWVALTADGRRALAGHLKTMRELMSRFEGPDAGQDPALVATFALGALLSVEQAGPAREVPSLGAVVLRDDDVPPWLERYDDMQINHYAEHLLDAAASLERVLSGRHDATKVRAVDQVSGRRAGMMELGLRGGYSRRWRGADPEEPGVTVFAHAELLEWPDAETAVEHVRTNGYRKWTVPADRELDNIQVWTGGPIVHMFTAVGRLSCMLLVHTAPLADESRHANLFAFAKQLAVAQRDRMASARWS